MDFDTQEGPSHMNSTLLQVPPQTNGLDAKEKKAIDLLKPEAPSKMETVAEDTSSHGVTFTFFSRLPAELRHKIWKYAVCCPQDGFVKTVC